MLKLGPYWSPKGSNVFLAKIISVSFGLRNIKGETLISYVEAQTFSIDHRSCIVLKPNYYSRIGSLFPIHPYSMSFFYHLCPILLSAI